MKISIIGLDLTKNMLQLHGVDAADNVSHLLLNSSKFISNF